LNSRLLPIALLATIGWACASTPSRDEQLRAHEAVLQAACPLGSSLQYVKQVLTSQEIAFTAMSAAACHESYVEVLGRSEACAGGPRIDAGVALPPTWFGLESSLRVTFLFNAAEQLVEATYTPWHTWF
jgi:hypothetical protein